MTSRYLRFIPCLLFASIACSTVPQKTGDFKIALTPARRGQHGIFVMKSDTTGGKLLTPDPGAQLRVTSWSPKGEKIAFFSTRPEDAEILASYRMPFHNLLYVIDAGGGPDKRLFDFPISSFEWSPNGRQLLYISAYEDPQHNDAAVVKGLKAPMSAIYIFDLQTGETKRLTSFGQNCSGSWSPDGSQLAVSFGTDQKSDIYAASLDVKHTRRITDSQIINIKPVWSPNGKMIAYVSISPQGAQDQDTGVYVMDAAGTDKRRISGMNAYSVAWSPDSKRLLLQSANELILTDAYGQKTVNPMSRIDRPLEAQFTPDGSEIIFRSNHEGDWNLYAVGLNGADMRRITGKLTASTFCLSPLRSRSSTPPQK